jgi:hypothetical protein
MIIGVPFILNIANPGYKDALKKELSLIKGLMCLKIK